MPTYKQTRAYHEDGYGLVTSIVVVSDTYEGLYDLAGAIEVNVILFEASDENIDAAAAVFTVAAADFSVIPDWASTADDDDCLAFIQAARVPATKRFIGRLINPHSSVERGDFAYVGVILPQADGEWKRLESPQWSSSFNIVWSWKFQSQSYDIREMLGAKMKDITKAIPQSWHDANVADRLGWFRWEPEAGRVYEGRYCNLVALQTLLQELLDQAAPPGITITYESVPLSVSVRPAVWQTYQASNGVWLRYSARYDSTTRNPMPYKVIVPDNVFPLSTGGDPEEDGSTWVSSRMISPVPGQDKYSWLAYETIGDLLYGLAKAFGAYISFHYDSSTAVRVRLGDRSEIDAGPCILKDVTKGSISSKAISAAADSKRLVGASWQYSSEGEAQYNYDGAGFTPAQASMAAPTEGEMLPIVVGPTFCLLLYGGADFFVDMADENAQAMMPHNAAMWDNGERRTPKIPEFNTESNHMGLYVRLTGRSGDGTYGCAGRSVWMPAGWLHYKLDGVTYGTDKLSTYLNSLYQRDQAYYDETLDIEVPYICSFRETEDGPMDWRFCALGKVVTIDALEWKVVGVRRQDYPTIATRLRLHKADRFATGVPDTAGITELTGGTSFGPPGAVGRSMLIGAPIAGEDISFGHAVSLRADGKVYIATAHHRDFGRVLGIALHDVLQGEAVGVQGTGRMTLPEAITLTPGDRVYIRTASDDGPNLSHDRLTGTTSTEDMLYDLGIAESARVINIDRRRQFVFEPPIPDEEPV